ncbi:MAG: hypothetical protein NVS2B2_29400 [Ktedonobacteraceae bacterium]
MVTSLLTVLLGGPPHAGKSVLLYNITHALQESDATHRSLPFLVEKGLVLDGHTIRLFTALVHLSTQAGMPWLAVRHIPLPSTRDGSGDSIS